MVSIFKKVGEVLDRIYIIFAVFAVLSLFGLLLLILYNILSRLLQIYSAGTTDMAGYFMIVATFFALPYTFRQHGHIAISFIVGYFNKRARRVIQITTLIVMFLCVSYLTYYLTKLVLDSYQFQDRSSGADATLLWIPQLPTALGTFLFSLAVLQTTIQESVMAGSYFDKHK